MTSVERPRRRLRLSAGDRKIAGVCGGFADYFNTDATLVRLAFVALLMLGGSGLVLYVVGWMIMPATPSTDAMLEQLGKLGDLKDAGVLTEAEFQTQKAKILTD